MKPTGFWLGCLAMAGSCLIWAGCGGSDVPDPASDSAAAAEPPAQINGGGPVAASAPEPAPAPPAQQATPEPPPKAEAATAATAPTPTPAPAPTPEAEPAKLASTATGSTDPAPTAEATPGATDPAPATPKGDASGTDEMLRIGGSSSPAPSGGSPAPASSPTPTPAVTAASSGGNNSPEARARGQESAANPALNLGSTAPGMAGGDEASRRGAGRMAGAGAGSFGAAGGSAANERDSGPASFRRPDTAVEAFLSALRAKNKDRLSQATAKRAATESVEKHQKIFAAILEGSISDEELDDMAKALEGFQVNGILPARSTGQVGVTIGRASGIDQLQRTVQVRREKEGWKVMDFGGVFNFKPTGVMRGRFGRR